MRLPVLLPLLAALSFAACQGDAPAGSHAGEAPADTLAESPTRDMADLGPYSDARFLQQMTAHHQMAIEMARMVPTMAESADLKTMAAKMDADQTREIADMATLLTATGETPDTTHTAGMNHSESSFGMPVTMDELHAARPFDRAFLVAMIGHHSTAITMATEAQFKTARAEVRQLATGIIRAQAAEIGWMQSMLDAMPVSASPAADTTHH